MQCLINLVQIWPEIWMGHNVLSCSLMAVIKTEPEQRDALCIQKPNSNAKEIIFFPQEAPETSILSQTSSPIRLFRRQPLKMKKKNIMQWAQAISASTRVIHTNTSIYIQIYGYVSLIVNIGQKCALITTCVCVWMRSLVPFPLSISTACASTVR